MTLDDVVTRAYLMATRKVGLSPGTPKYAQLAAIADMKQKDWQNEQGMDWASLYEYVDIGTVSTTDTYELDDTIRKISSQEGDRIYVLRTDGQKKYYNLVTPDRLPFYSDGVARAGSNLLFREPFAATSDLIGGSIVVPSYVYVDDLVNTTDEVQVDDPQWLIYITAAEYVRNDTRRQNQYGNLVALSDDRMNKMKENNGGQLTEIPIFTDYPTSYSDGWDW